jgi:hypothetical protein
MKGREAREYKLREARKVGRQERLGGKEGRAARNVEGQENAI